MSSAKRRPFCLDPNVLNITRKLLQSRDNIDVWIVLGHDVMQYWWLIPSQVFSRSKLACKHGVDVQLFPFTEIAKSSVSATFNFATAWWTYYLPQNKVIMGCLSLVWAYFIIVPNLNIMTSKQNGHHFTNDIFKWIFFNDDYLTLIKISLQYVPLCLIDNVAAPVHIMAWHQTDDKQLPDPKMAQITDVINTL